MVLQVLLHPLHAWQHEGTDCTWQLPNLGAVTGIRIARKIREEAHKFQTDVLLLPKQND